MTYSESRSLNNIRSFIENKFKEKYPYSEIDGRIVFSLPDGVFMKVSQLGGDFNALVMDYIEEDGDLYYPDDYETLDALFEAMLEETKM